QPTIRRLTTDAPRVNATSANVPPLASFDIAQDKWQLAQFARRHALPHPTTVLAAGLIDDPAERNALDFPILLKPRSGANGAGIVRVPTADALVAELQQVTRNPWDYIAQVETTGYDIDCSVLCRQGEVIAHTVQRGIAAQ